MGPQGVWCRRQDNGITVYEPGFTTDRWALLEPDRVLAAWRDDVRKAGRGWTLPALQRVSVRRYAKPDAPGAGGISGSVARPHR